MSAPFPSPGRKIGINGRVIEENYLINACKGVADPSVGLEEWNERVRRLCRAIGSGCVLNSVVSEKES